MKLIAKWVCSISLGTMAIFSTTVSLQAADSLILVYGPLKQSVKISSLESFVQTGQINQELEFYLRSATPEQKERFRSALVEKVPIDAVALSHFLNSSIGNAILERFGRIVTLPGGASGKLVLRGSIVQAALDREGLTLLNVLRKLSTNVQIDGENLLRINNTIDQFLQSTKEAVKSLQAIAQKEVTNDPVVNYAKLPDLSKPGPYKYQQETWQLRDNFRQRAFYTLVYKPKVPPKQKIPVVIVSHGLASRPEDFGQLATALASNGFLVALPQHPGSDLKQAKALLEGSSKEVFELQEFIDRPKDISFVIDELERRNKREYQGRLNLQQVGVIGHSFGGYTALALAGAQIDFESLKEDCSRFNYLNLSLLLQCGALNLPRQTYQLADPRVAAIIAKNPLDSGIFGKGGLQKVSLPTFLMAGSYDLVTPAVPEQMFSFPLLIKAPESYLGIVEGESHVDFSQLDAGISDLVESVTHLALPSPELVNTYTNSVSVAFFKVYIAGDKKYLPYLQSSYAAYLSQNQNFKFSLLTSRSKDAVSVEVQRLKEGFALGR